MEIPIEVKLEVTKIWIDSAGLDGTEAERRLTELILLVRTGDGKLAGVATASKIKVKFLNNNWFYNFRYFVVPSFRAAGLDIKIIAEASALLQIKSTMEPERTIGIMAVSQNKNYQQVQSARRTVLLNVPFVFAGFTRSGHSIQVCYFEDVTI